MRVLIAEASAEDTRRLLSILHTLPDIKIVGMVSSITQALSSVEQAQPSVVLIGLSDDWEGVVSLLEFIRTYKPACQSIVLTGSRSSDIPRRAFALGSNFVIQKSVGLDELPEVLRQCAQKQSEFAL